MKLLLLLKKVLPHTQNTEVRRIHFKQLVFLSAIIGICGGLLASAYIFVLKEVLHFVWDVGKPAIYRILPSWLRAVNPIWIITAVGGLFVGLALKFLGQCGEISAVVNNINMKKGSIDIRQTPSMTVTSLISIGFGGSAGPEAPLVQIIGSLGSKIGERLKLHGDVIRTLTFSGMGAALGALFSAPLGGALFALEIPHRRGLGT